MKNMNSNISSLFSSLNTGNTMFGSFNLGDYASIKNGSYGKLLKAHYAEEKKAASESAKTTTTKTTENGPVDLNQFGVDLNSLGAMTMSL